MASDVRFGVPRPSSLWSGKKAIQMRKLIGFWAIAVVALMGCVEFERQTIVYRHDVERDELRMLMIYEGIHGKSTGDFSELRSVLLRPRTFFFTNWILEYDRDDWVRELEHIDRDRDAKPAAYKVAYRRLIKLMLHNVRVDNGAFYLNSEGKLSGYQQVTFSRVSELVSAVNQMVNVALIHGELRSEDVLLASSRSADVILGAAYTSHQWVRVDEGELRLRVPLSNHDYEAFQREVQDDATWQRVVEAGLREVYIGGVAEFVFGEYGHSQTTISMDVFDGPYIPNMLPFVEEDGLLEPSPDFETIIQRFVERQLAW